MNMFEMLKDLGHVDPPDPSVLEWTADALVSAAAESICNVGTDSGWQPLKGRTAGRRALTAAAGAQRRDPEPSAATALTVRAEAERDDQTGRDATLAPMAGRLSPQRRWIGRHRAPVAAGMVGAAAAVVVGVVFGIGSGVVAPNLPAVLASWKATPTTPAPGQLSAADAECVAAENQLATQSPDPLEYRGSWRPVLDDTRSTDTLVLMTAASATSHDFGACLTDVATPSGEPIYWAAVNPSPAVAEPGALAGISIGGNDRLEVATGEAGSGVTGVSFTLPDGTVVATSVDNSLFAAWWPSTLAPVSVTVTSTYGTVTEQFPAPGTPVGQIPAGEIGPAGTTTPPPGAPDN